MQMKHPSIEHLRHISANIFQSLFLRLCVGFFLWHLRFTLWTGIIMNQQLGFHLRDFPGFCNHLDLFLGRFVHDMVRCCHNMP